MAAKELVVVLDGEIAGTLTEDRHGAVGFAYSDSYLALDEPTPLSLSIPLVPGKAKPSAVLAFLWGLLPDNDAVLSRWGQQYQVSPSSAFGLLSNVGEEVAGAAQFVRPEKVDDLNAGGIRSITEQEIGDRLRNLRTDPSAWQLTSGGQFSLAGAQAKFALRKRRNEWGQPWGHEPTDTIIKPAAGHLRDQDLDEHLCLELARAVGLTAARSQVRAFDGERAICVDRYDRTVVDRALIRVHQEDLCQALGLRPQRKYQSDGGPGPRDVIRLLRRSVTPAERAETAVWRFLDALALNWLIAGTDAHAKNYSLLLSGSNVALAPLYDVSSILPYVTKNPQPDRFTEWNRSEIHLAMTIGSHNRIQEVTAEDWRALASDARVDEDALLQRISELLEGLAGHLDRILEQPDVQALESALPQRFTTELERHLGLCRSVLLGRPIPSRAPRRTARGR